MSVSVDEYENRFPVWRELEQEVSYTLDDAIKSNGIKVHAVELRIKELISIIGKVASNTYNDPLSDIKDIVGARVITLFLSDLPKIDDIIRNAFYVVSKDDKTAIDNSAVGYRSIHYICKTKPEYNGPRYKKISNIEFEIQVRTLCMHAWSAVSHYIDYKGDWDVPKELRNSLKALSGLFHIADSQFEQFSKAREDYYNAIPKNKGTTEINLDSILDLLSRRYPDRPQHQRSGLSEFVQELSDLGINSVEELDKILNDAKDRISEIENIRPTPYGALGAARVSLGIISQNYRDLKYDGRDYESALKLFATA